MTDDELRHVLSQAHGDDAPPALSAILAGGRARRPRPRRAVWLLVPVAAALLLAVFWLRRPSPRLARIDLGWRAPTDFLLVLPGAELLRETPRFDVKGFLP